MELMVLRIFQRQVQFQCEVGLRAVAEINTSLRFGGYQVSSDFWVAMQNFLNASANLAKAFWGSYGNETVKLERKPLRESLGVTDDSPLSDVTVRNKFEHYDEYVDAWWKKSKQRNHLDLSFMDGGPMGGTVVGMDIKDMFRVFDRANMRLTFHGWEVDIQALAREIDRIQPLAAGEASKPYWEPSNPSASPYPTSPESS